MPFIHQPGNVDVYYETYGAGEPLLLSHGYSYTSEMWAGQISELSKCYQVIIWDMRGHGRSSYPQDPALYTQAHILTDMKTILDVVCGDNKAIIGGMSLGGYMSLAFYRAHPHRVSQLLIINTGPGFRNDKAREAWNRNALKTAAAYEKREARGAPDGSDGKLPFGHRNAKGLILAARGMLTQHDDKVISALADINVPTLIVAGSLDKPLLGAADYMAAKIRGAEKIVIADAGHASNIDQPDSFNTAVLRFLHAHAGRSSRL